MEPLLEKNIQNIKIKFILWHTLKGLSNQKLNLSSVVIDSGVVIKTPSETPPLCLGG